MSSKVRIWDLAKDLNADPKELIDVVRREGVDVTVPSNTISSELANIIRAQYSSEKTEESLLPSREFIALTIFDEEIRVVSLTPDGSYRFLDDTNNLHNLFYIVSSETLALKIAVEELEDLVNDPYSKEADFQDFFERYPEFILNDEYKKAHPHIVLTKDDEERLIPDFVLEPVYQNALCDLLELKLPTAPIFVLKARRMRFSAAVAEACAQLREYSLFFDEERNRKTVYEKYGLLAYKPKMFVIIGRRGDINPIDARRVELDFPNLYLRTYDDVIVRVKMKVEEMKKGRR